MTGVEIAMIVGAALGSGVAAEIARRAIPGTKHDNTAVKVLGFFSRVLTLGASTKFKGDGRLKKQ